MQRKERDTSPETGCDVSTRADISCDPPPPPTLWQFIDDPGLKNDTRNMPVQLPLAHSGWLFKEESEEPEAKPFSAGPKEEDMEVDVPAVKGNVHACVS